MVFFKKKQKPEAVVPSLVEALRLWASDFPKGKVCSEVQSYGFETGPFAKEMACLHVYAIMLALRTLYPKQWESASDNLLQEIQESRAFAALPEVLSQQELSTRLSAYMQIWNDASNQDDNPLPKVAKSACLNAYGESGASARLAVLFTTLFMEYFKGLKEDMPKLT